MSKKKLAVFAGGWGGEYLVEVLAGIIGKSEKENFDIFAFVNFSINTDVPDVNELEVNFFKMPNLEDFDAVVFLTNSFNRPEEIEYFSEQISKFKIPAVSIEYELSDLPTITSNNYSGMYSLVEHMITVHSSHDIVMVSGPSNHNESILRVQATKDALHAHNLELPEDNILEGNWGKDTIPDLIDSWFEKNEKLPDAFICANDIMAMAVIDEIRQLGFDVPRDVLVTGYDCISQARHFDPPISSVNHSWGAMGQQAFDMIKDLLDGKKVEKNVSLDTVFMTGRTCGCDMRGSNFSSKTLATRALTRTIMGPIEMDSHFRHFHSAVRKVNNSENLFGSFSWLFEHSHIIEGDEFSLFLYPEFYSTTQEDSEIQPFNATVIDRTVCLRSGKAQPRKTVDMDELIFDAARNRETPGYYLFVPLHSANILYGCAMLNGPLNAASENQYYIWSMHMVQALEQYSANVTINELYKKMEQLSVTDPLTGAYNRAGCEKISYPKLIEWGREGGKSIIMLIDVDRMKLINDKFGHFSGDIALKIVVDALKASLPESFIISRFGGDEFFIAGTLKDSSFNINKTLFDIDEYIKNRRELEKIAFPLSVSIGYEIISPKEVSDIEHGIDHADQDMYKNKEIHHMQSDAE